MSQLRPRDPLYRFLLQVSDLGPSLKSDEIRNILGEEDHSVLVDILTIAYKKVYEIYGSRA